MLTVPVTAPPEFVIDAPLAAVVASLAAVVDAMPCVGADVRCARGLAFSTLHGPGVPLRAGGGYKQRMPTVQQPVFTAALSPTMKWYMAVLGLEFDLRTLLMLGRRESMLAVVASPCSDLDSGADAGWCVDLTMNHCVFYGAVQATFLDLWSRACRGRSTARHPARGLAYGSLVATLAEWVLDAPPRPTRRHRVRPARIAGIVLHEACACVQNNTELGRPTISSQSPRSSLNSRSVPGAFLETE